MDVCFIMYPWEEVDPKSDSTLVLMHECFLRGFGVSYCIPANLTIRNSETYAFCHILSNKGEKSLKSINAFYKNVEMREELLPLIGFDAILMRANPPLDPLMLNFLDSVKDDVFIVNGVHGLRIANNKLYTAAFEDSDNEIIPVTHVSKNKKYLREIIASSDSQRMILKPLNGYGGSGVILIEKNAISNINSLLDFYVSGENNNYVILQDYIEGAENGDVRIIMLNGEPIGAMRRVPAEGDHRSNVSSGGQVVKHTLTKVEKELCKIIGPKLVQDELYFVGIDVINGKLVEINVLSPGGIRQINKLNKSKIHQKIIDFVEKKVSFRQRQIDRRSKLKSTVKNA